MSSKDNDTGTYGFGTYFVGVGIGAIAGGPVGAAIAFVALKFLDSIGNDQESENPHDPDEDVTYAFELIFAALGYLAKADGRISPAEIDMAEKIMVELDLDEAQKPVAREAFRQGRDGNITALAACEALAEFENAAHIGEVTLEYLARMGWLDGGLSPDQRLILRALAFRAFTCTHEQVDRLTEFEPDTPDSGEAALLAAAAEILGVTPEATEDQIRRAFRALAQKYHPDTLSGQRIAAEVVALAEQQFKKIKDAHDLLISARTAHT